MAKEKIELEFVEASLETTLEEMKNRRDFIKKAMKPAEKAADDLEKATATEKVRLQGTKETKVPNLKPYTEALDVRDRKELGQLISGAKADGRPWTVKRCSEEKLKEGYRYTFFTNKVAGVFNESLHKEDLTLNEEPLTEASEEEVELELPPVEAPAEIVDIAAEEPIIEPEQSAECDECHKAIDILKSKLNFHPGEEEGTFVLCLTDEDGKETECVEIKGLSEEELTTLNAIFFEHEEFAKEQEEETPIEEVPEEEVVELELDESKHDENYESIVIKPVFVSEVRTSRDELRDLYVAYKVNKEKKVIGPVEMFNQPLYGMSLSELKHKLEEHGIDNYTIDEQLDEASSAEKRAFKNGGDDLKDLEFGKALARIKDPHERAMLLHQHKLEQSGKLMSDRAEVNDTLARKLSQAEVAAQDKFQAMHDAGYAAEESEEEKPLEEGVKISLDDLTLFKPWGGAKDVWDLIIAQDKLEALDKALEDMYPEGITATDLNDILWFEKDWIFDTIDLKAFMPQEDAIEAQPAEVVDAEVETSVEEA